MTRTSLFGLGIVFWVAYGTAAAEPPTTEIDGLGMSVAQAVEVCEPDGERQYLARLVCPDQSHPEFQRIGNFGLRDPNAGDMSREQVNQALERMLASEELKPGEPHLHIVDGYEVSCGESKTTIYLDMYHCNAKSPDQAPPGFSIVQ